MSSDKPRVVVVGIGADGMAGLAPASRAELQRATAIYGSRRQLDLLDDTVTAQRRVWPTPLVPALGKIQDDAEDEVHIVASGDPMLHGIGGSVIRFFGADRVTVLPHVSSVTLACARLGWAVQDTEVISLMMAAPHTAIRRGGQAVVLTRDGSGPATLARLLAESGRGDSEFNVLEELGGPSERRRSMTARQWADTPPTDVDDLNVVAVRYLPDERQSQVLPDDAFEHDGQITKQSIRAITLAALAPRPGELLWDVGAGSGSISIEWCRSGPGCRAIAFEQDEVRRQRITDNAIKHGVEIEVRGAAPRSFREAILTDGGVDGVQRPTAIFVGGGTSEYQLLNTCFQHLPQGGRLVANAVTLEGEVALASCYSRLGGELRRFQHYQGAPIGSFTGWRPAMPITQWIVHKP
ncbi:precorrin-6y C5,15-methyltransferase (decarboxylating) subunit CbiE [Mycolicibacterium mengxianglii]|uniref:precorrin-6y C5,15-methyltransferase (decarboxylating) subunit CbiE n=1 Tax=Mycolicibacterium mengxianglii TaxID=2736649 RepID=UPI0018EF12A0|nr:precorrin-6y C5,15-methyltransferase (decarboxylating) subunit CbiE [Mycolicibacterium mengxianglii]